MYLSPSFKVPRQFYRVKLREEKKMLSFFSRSTILLIVLKLISNRQMHCASFLCKLCLRHPRIWGKKRTAATQGICEAFKNKHVNVAVEKMAWFRGICLCVYMERLLPFDTFCHFNLKLWMLQAYSSKSLSACEMLLRISMVAKQILQVYANEATRKIKQRPVHICTHTASSTQIIVKLILWR